MPLVLTVKQLLEMSEGGKPEAFKGTITKVYKVSTGTNDKGAWSLQKIVIKDETGQIECMLSNRPELSRTVEGSKVYVIAGRGEKGTTGLQRKDNSWTKKGDSQPTITPQVWIYDSADVSFESSGSAASKPAGDAPAAGSTGSQARTQAPADPPPSGDKKEELAKLRAVEMARFDTRLGRNCAALSRCYDAAFRLASEVDARHKDQGGFKPSFTDLKEIATTLFVQTGWVEKPGEIDGFPVKPFQNYDATGHPLNGNGTSQPKAGAPFN